MGEASRRKHSDPTFGRIPKDASKRGLVVCPPIEIEGSKLFAKSSHLDPKELRFALLFWDRLVWPSSRAIYFASGQDEQFLESAKILTRPDYTFNGDMAQGIARGQIQAFLDLEKKEPGAWALAQGENSLQLQDAPIENGAGVIVELHRAIPIPTETVPLNDILEFKERRHDELIVLRNELDGFASEIEAAVNAAEVLRDRLADIDTACANLLKVSAEWRFPIYLSNMKASFNFSPTKFLPAAGLGWKLGEAYGLTAATIAAASAGVVSTLEMKADLGLRSISRPKTPYRYACSMYNELK